MRGFALRLTPALSLLALLAACASPPPASAPTQSEAPVPTAPAVEAGSASSAPAEPIVSQPLKHLRGRNLKALPESEINITTKCAFKDVAGGRGKMDLAVTKAEVKRFVAEIEIPKQGLCQFDLKDFKQTAKLPHVILKADRGGCVVSMWQQGRSITVAFNACQAQCGGDAFSYLWPLLVDSKSGRCS